MPTGRASRTGYQHVLCRDRMPEQWRRAIDKDGDLGGGPPRSAHACGRVLVLVVLVTWGRRQRLWQCMALIGNELYSKLDRPFPSGWSALAQACGQRPRRGVS
jgi:hypothetical protein